MYEKYIIVDSFEKAVNYLEKYSASAKIVSGGTDLFLEFERGGHEAVRNIIDISRMRDMDYIQIDDEGIVHIGCMVTHSGCLRSEIIRKYVNCLYEACEQVGSPQIRNRGTIAGNVVTASPANDTITALMVLNAKLVLHSAGHSRVVEIENFFTGPRKTVLAWNEMIKEITFDLPKPDSRSVFLKNGLRKAQAISLLNTAVFLEMDNSVIKNVRIAMGAVGPKVIRAIQAEEFLRGIKATDEIFAEAGKIAASATKPISDVRSSKEYRGKMIEVSVKRALTKAFQGVPKNESLPVTLWGQSKNANKPLFEESYFEMDQNSPIELNVNGNRYKILNAFEKNLMDMLRENLEFTGTKEGCGEGECGACTVYMDGVAVLACLVPAPRAHKTEILTIEGINNGRELHKIQQAMVEEGAVQCGYCTPGFVMSSVKLLDEKNKPSRKEIETAISGNLCRCTGYYKIISAIEKAAER